MASPYFADQLGRSYARLTALRDTIAPLSERYFLYETYAHEFHDALAHLEGIGFLRWRSPVLRQQ